MTPSLGCGLQIHHAGLVLQREEPGKEVKRAFLVLCHSYLQSDTSLFAVICLETMAFFGRYFLFCFSFQGWLFFFFLLPGKKHLLFIFPVLQQAVPLLVSNSPAAAGLCILLRKGVLQWNNYSWLKSLLGWSEIKADNEHHARQALCESQNNTCLYIQERWKACTVLNSMDGLILK